MGDLDRLKGYVHVKDILDECLAGNPFDVRSVIKQGPIVPERMPALRVLDTLRAANSHLAFVVNEHGGVDGLVTITDVLQAIVRGVPASSPGEEPVAVRRDDGSWLIDGIMPAWEIQELLGLQRLPGEHEGAFTTVGGFIMTRLGKVPRAGDYFEYDGWRFEVVDMDGNRVDKVLVIPNPQSHTAEDH